jgi:diaminohydroxyphosphoribosylaminopyrimidine deaminase/5-amino-6-(5-phosphoribosylamino)uracil reductase
MSGEFSTFDGAAMARAIELAKRGLETTDPNPRVGCVIALRDKIIAEGWHEWAGEAHAEAMALRTLSGGKAKGATAYVTLEPCAHVGRTPPCVHALIDAGVSRVVYAVDDPNPYVTGGGAQLLREARIQVESGLMAAEAEALNFGYLKRMRTGQPYVRLKLAMSLDGRTALANGSSQWITSEGAREDVQRWRAQSSAVLSSISTVLADDPRLNVRTPATRRREPLRVILDSEMRTPPDAKMFSVPGEIVIFTACEEAERIMPLINAGARVEVVGRAPADDGVDLGSVFTRLAELDMNEVFVESGSTLAGALVHGGFVDELLIYMAPIMLGPQARPLLAMSEITSLDEVPRFEILEAGVFGADWRLRLRRSHGV